MAGLSAGARYPLKASSYASLTFDLEGEGWSKQLVAAGFDPSMPSVWVLEAVVIYMSEEGVDNLLREARSIAAKGSRLLIMVSCFRPCPCDAPAGKLHSNSECLICTSAVLRGA